MNTKWFFTIVMVMIVALGVGLSAVRTEKSLTPKPAPSTVTAPEIKDYKKWKVVNPYGFALSPEMQALCRSVSPDELDKSSHPDAKGKYIHVLVNEKGRAAMFQAKNPRFPAGSVIVKEKWGVKNSKQPELLTVMIKQRAGYDPKKGDWEYLTVDGSGQKVQARGQLANCQRCHVTKAKDDYVFRPYVRIYPHEN